MNSFQVERIFQQRVQSVILKVEPSKGVGKDETQAEMSKAVLVRCFKLLLEMW